MSMSQQYWMPLHLPMQLPCVHGTESVCLTMPWNLWGLCHGRTLHSTGMMQHKGALNKSSAWLSTALHWPCSIQINRQCSQRCLWLWTWSHLTQVNDAGEEDTVAFASCSLYDVKKILWKRGSGMWLCCWKVPCVALGKQIPVTHWSSSTDYASDYERE